MPNWCSNTVLISGYPLEDLDRLEKALRESIEPIEDDCNIELFSSFVPEDGKTAVWDLWGTSKCAFYAQLYRDKRSLALSFDSAWGPPLPVIQAMSRAFPNMRFSIHYDEPGMSLKGYVVYKGGNEVKAKELK